MRIEVTIHTGTNTNNWKERYIVGTKRKKIIYEKIYRKEVKNGKIN